MYICNVICIYANMEKLIETIVTAIQDKKGENIVSLDLSGFDGAICSHFIICNANSTSQVSAIADGIERDVLEKLGEKVWRIEGQQNAFWIAMDYLDVVVHIFLAGLLHHISSVGIIAESLLFESLLFKHSHID